MRLRSISLVITASTLILQTTAFAEDSSITEKELVRRMQELFDAVAPGDQIPWNKYYADDCLYRDEKGRSLTSFILSRQSLSIDGRVDDFEFEREHHTMNCATNI